MQYSILDGFDVKLTRGYLDRILAVTLSGIWDLGNVSEETRSSLDGTNRKVLREVISGNLLSIFSNSKSESRKTTSHLELSVFGEMNFPQMRKIRGLIAPF